MERYQLLYFFKDLIEVGIKNPGRPGFGWPCSHLLRALMLRQQSFIDKIVGDYTNEFQEYRLNGAGLKLHWKVERDGHRSLPRFKCYISGDQAKDYPEFLVCAKELIRQWGFVHR